LAQTYISETENITDNSFYYNQLDTYGKTIYSRLYANLDNLKTGLYSVDFDVTFNELLQTDSGEQTLTNAFQLAINALLLDHPEIFYLDVTKMYMFTESSTTIRGTTYKITIGPDSDNSYLAEGFSSKDDILSAEEEINNILYTIKSSLKGNINNQLKQIHNYLIDTIEYDSVTDSDMSHSIYGAFIKKYAVCDGYAKAFKFILDNINISCVEVCGIAQNSAGVTQSHAWNDVLLNGKWYAVDVTWDDPIIVGGNGVLTNDLRYNYFLKGSDTFYLSHQEDGYIVENGEFKYPVLNTTAY
jgi:transglutaminase/protease-like cytokinesis protein 3